MIATADTFEGRQRAARRHRGLIAVSGVVLVAIIVGLVGTIIASFDGKFTSYVAVHAVLPTGQPVDPQAAVEYLQIPVGTVASVGHALPSGAVSVTLHLKPGKIADIPGNVTASVAPSSVCGTEAVILTSPRPSAARLRSGETIAAGGTSSSLQGALSDLDNLLTGLHPAEIDTTLGALATALQGQGPAFGVAIDELNAYVNGLLPQLPTLEKDIDLVTPVLDGLSASVPALLQIATNSGTVATTLSQEQTLIASLLTKGTTLTAVSRELLSGVTATIHAFLVNAAPLLFDVNGQPGVLPASVTAIDDLAKTFIPAFDQGPYVNVYVASFYVNEPQLALLAAYGAASGNCNHQQVTQLAHNGFLTLMDPPTYSATDCPHYGAEAGTNCSGTSPATASSGAKTKTKAKTSAERASATADSLASAPELTAPQQAATNRLASLLDGGKAVTLPSVADLLLSPLLQSLVP